MIRILNPVRVTAPADPVVTLAEMKAHARVDHADEDGVLTALVQGAIDHMDGWSGVLGRCLVTQTWRLALNDWPGCGDIRLPFPDVQSVTVKYSDADDVEQTVDASLYELLADAKGAFVRFRDDFTSPTVFDDRSDGVRIDLVAGYGDPGDVPWAIRTAILMLATHWYQHRAAALGVNVSELPLGVQSLIAPYRRVSL